jgi:hypothetical protein
VIPYRCSYCGAACVAVLIISRIWVLACNTEIHFMWLMMVCLPILFMPFGSCLHAYLALSLLDPCNILVAAFHVQTSSVRSLFIGWVTQATYPP